MAFYEVLKALSTALTPNRGAGLSACNLPVAAALGGLLDTVGQQQDNSGNRVSWLILSSYFPNKFGFGGWLFLQTGIGLMAPFAHISCFQAACSLTACTVQCELLRGKAKLLSQGTMRSVRLEVMNGLVCNPGEQLFSTAPGLPWRRILHFPVVIP